MCDHSAIHLQKIFFLRSIVILACVLGLVLVGCGGGDDEDNVAGN